MKLYMHVGMQKAGSKAIQGFLSDNTAQLRARGIDCAAKLRSGIWHQDLFLGYNDDFDTKLAAMAADADAVVLSYEKAYTTDAATIARLVSHASSVAVLFFCRPPIHWINSIKNQIVKAHRTRIDVWDDFTVENDFVKSALRISEQLDKWEQIVGKDNISVAAFSPQSDVVPVLIDWLGIPHDDRHEYTLRDKNPNPALDARSIRIILEVKRRLAGAPLDTQIKAIGLCHEALRGTWIDTRHAPGVMLVSDTERRYCDDVYSPQYRAVLDRYETIGFDNRNRPVEEFNHMKIGSFSPSSAERDIAADIVDQAYPDRL